MERVAGKIEMAGATLRRRSDVVKRAVTAIAPDRESVFACAGYVSEGLRSGAAQGIRRTGHNWIYEAKAGNALSALFY